MSTRIRVRVVFALMLLCTALLALGYTIAGLVVAAVFVAIMLRDF